MTRTIAVAFLILGIAATIKWTRPENPQSGPERTLPDKPVSKKTGPVTTSQKLSTDNLENIERKINSIREQLQNTEHELQSFGFPKVLLDSRLSEIERNMILMKVNEASALQNQLAMLKLQKIETESEHNPWAN